MTESKTPPIVSTKDRLMSGPSKEPLPTTLDPAGSRARGYPANPKPVPKKGQGDPNETNLAPDDIGRTA